MCALKLEVTSTTGMVISGAYIKVDEYSCGKGNVVNARLRAYVSKELANSGASSIEGSEEIITFTVEYSDESDNPKKQIYEFVKNMDKYSDAIDC